jgi:hypothetical protein
MFKGLIYCTSMVLFCTAALAQDISTPRTAPKLKARETKAPEASPEAATTTKSSNIDAFVFNLGAHTEFYNSVQTDDSGTLRKFDPSAVIGAGFVMPIDYGLIFLPELNWVLPQKAGSSKIIKNLFMLRADLGYDPLTWLRLRVGTSLMWLNQHGGGGSAQVNNGNGTSTFYYPDENRSSVNNTFDLGVEALMDAWSVRLQTYTYALFKEERRQVSYTLFVSYYWDQ